MQTLMDSEEPSRRIRLGKRAARYMAAVGALLVIGSGIAAKQYTDRKADEEFRHDVAMYLAFPGFTGRDFAPQVLGPDTKLELYDPEERKIYLGSSKPPEGVLPKVSERPDTAEILDEKQKLTAFGFTRNNIFAFPVRDLSVDKNASVKIDFGSVEYDITLEELSDFLNERSVCGGYGLVSTGGHIGRLKGFTNHQFYTARRGEPSLARFAQKLTGGLSTKEEKAQRLLDFVTQRIRYDGNDILDDTQKIKRANEVLMTGEADCSGKSVLYASLLEQAGIDYYIMYFFPERGDGHMTVAVEGDFPDINGLAFDIDGRKYHIAETTTEGFRIGRTRLANSEDFHSGRRYFQQACYKQNILHRFVRGITSNSDVINLDTGVPLKLSY